MCHILCAWPLDTARDGTMTCKKTGKDFATKVALQKVAEMLKKQSPAPASPYRTPSRGTTAAPPIPLCNFAEGHGPDLNDEGIVPERGSSAYRGVRPTARY